MTPQENWFFSKIGKEVRVFVGGINQQTGTLKAVDSSGIVLGDRWFNMAHIVYAEDTSEPGRTMRITR